MNSDGLVPPHGGCGLINRILPEDEVESLIQKARGYNPTGERYMVCSQFAPGDFVEVYVRVSLSVCEQRDAKGLYKKARKGEIKDFTGISTPYEEPENPELIIDTDGETEEKHADVAGLSYQ